MTEERWASLKTATWFRQEQDEVTAYVEQLRGECARLRHELVSARAFFTDGDGEPCGIAPGDAEDVVTAIDAALGGVHAEKPAAQP